MSFFDPEFDPCEGDDDLLACSNQEAWEDAQADMRDMDMSDPDAFDRQAESVLYPWLDTEVLADDCYC